MPGDTVIKEGSPANSLILVARGRVEVISSASASASASDPFAEAAEAVVRRPCARPC